MSAGLSPVDVLADLPPPRWDTLARAVRRAVDQLPAAQVPVALRPFSRWHPDALRGAARARRAAAEALVFDARFRAEVAEAIAGEDERVRARAIDPLSLRAEVGGEQAVALLTVTEQWSGLATLAAVLVAERSATGQTAAEQVPGPAPGPTSAKVRDEVYDDVRTLRRQVHEARRREAELLRLMQKLVSERDDARAVAAREHDARAADIQRHDRDRAQFRKRLAQLRQRVGLAERRAVASDALRAEIVDELAALTERLQTPPAPDTPRRSAAGDGGADSADGAAAPAAPPRDGTPAIPHRIGPAAPGRPCRLPSGVDPASVPAVVSLLQVAGLRVFIDGYNVSKDVRGVPAATLEQQRAWLVRVVSGVVARFDVRPTIVFDGTPDIEGTAARGRGVIVRFTADETADERLVALLDGLTPDAPALVVTSDREIRDAATVRNANSVSSGAFLAALVV